MPRKKRAGDTGVYKWTNTKNGKVYVGGAAEGFTQRKTRYLSDFKRGVCHNQHLLRAWRLYGPNSFELSIIEYCPPDKVAERETYWIARLDATNKHKGYNVCKEGKNCLGVKCSQATKIKISIAKLGRSNGCRGHKHTAEAKMKMSLAKRGKQLRLGAVLSEQTKEKIRRAQLGKKASAETKAKMSNTRMGRKQSPEHLKKTRETHWSKGPNAKAIAAKIGASSKGKRLSEETKRKISEAKRGATKGL